MGLFLRLDGKVCVVRRTHLLDHCCLRMPRKGVGFVDAGRGGGRGGGGSLRLSLNPLEAR